MEVFYVAPGVMGGAFPQQPQRLQTQLKSWPRLLVLNLAHEGPTYIVSGIDIEEWPVMDGQNMAFGDLVAVVDRMVEYVDMGTNHGVFVHCRHGKGRTGTVLVAYLMRRYGAGVDAANALLAKRHRLYRIGVTVKCQLRYLHYYGEYLQERAWETDSAYVVDSLEILGGGRWQFDVAVGVVSKCAAVKAGASGVCWTPVGKLSSEKPNTCVLSVAQDIRVEVRVRWFAWVTYATFSINLDFEASPLLVPFEDMDGFRGTAHKGKKTFGGMRLLFHKTAL